MLRDIDLEMMYVRVAMLGRTRKEMTPFKKYLGTLESMKRRLRGDVPGMPDERETERQEQIREGIHKERNKHRVKRGTMLIKRKGDGGQRKKRTADNPPS